MYKPLSLVIFTALLAACTPKPMVSPIEQVSQKGLGQALTISPSNKKTTTIQKRTALYQCKKQQTVKITTSPQERKTITVEFNQTSHKLFSSVPKQSKKKYSNIRWIWTENFNGVGTLRDKSGKVLAEQCVKK